MFYIYTPIGRTFSGSLESLRRVERPARAQPSQMAPDDIPERAAEAPPANVTAITGEVTAASSVQAYRKFLADTDYREPAQHAYQIMSQPVVSINNTQSVEEALALFSHYPYQSLPVKNANGQLVASLEKKWLYEQLIAADQPKRIKSLPIATLIASLNGTPDTQVVSAAPVTDVRRIAAAMVEFNLDAIPVVDPHGLIIGIVSRTDILKAASTEPPLSVWC